MRVPCMLAATVATISFLTVSSIHASAQTPSPTFFGLDAYIGGMPRPDPPTEGEPTPDYPAMGGWQTGASLRFIPTVRWLGVAGNYASYSNEAVRVRDVLVGARANSPWLAEDVLIRGFGHALAGWASETTVDGQNESSGMMVVGGGADFLLFRIQVEYVRSDLPHRPLNDVRGFLGGMVPLCFAGCRNWKDGFDLSHGR